MMLASGWGSSIQLRMPDGRILETGIQSVEFIKKTDGKPHVGLILSSEISEQDIPKGTELWLLSGTNI